MLLRGLRLYGKWCRFSSPITQFLTLTVVTFGVLAPLICHRLLHSYFYLRRWHLNPMSEEFLKQNQEDGQTALRYFEDLRTPNSSEISGGKALRPWLLITIVTVQRRNEFHYVLQVASRFHRLLQQCGPRCQSYQVFICNVEQDPGNHQDAKLLGNFFAMVSRYKNWEDPDAAVNQFEKEKRDYAFCMEQSLLAYNPEYILLVEDDAVPEEEIFPLLQHLLLERLSKPHLKDALYLKLYHPERLQRYINPEPMRILEWLGLGMFLGPLLSFAYSWVSGRPSLTWPIVLFFALYSMALAELVGRHYLLELRRLAPVLYNVVPVTECCMPAMVFSASSARRVLGYLQELHCRPGFAKDTALYSLLRTKDERAYVVEPNLVRHVGMFSSLRPNNIPKLL
ncbi:post-GPI attachment to proteins factor 4 [Mauremys reevesii]|uniref:post-GPI attachment to proteins factor 4 n=1 Tax=Mauremys reevesii TaxID=260615 RepID=UPI00193F0949|nr:post-GPI attachment to proteins factor 4 [Mauremys reevesii]XP_039399895.1 post-GPI attachment to proteins factor 4 [Mauremys reevesii]XP_039399896.1 post-GPI attachment to proteins factor 4 [Mauremys reevesii]XP_039399897.1 post-GPI attachment to proteins factor 4 [Mauremys reevesii]XP_039399898.1 post-GPI attachment to proteins factor 4 [Mauremys reevesii]XP_039399899.1 post-GPI attachment to proteins factor 4 [Mauremys reevesii]XP_039399900.1 post-GPI attachment to proteins factor 4 [Ma